MIQNTYSIYMHLSTLYILCEYSFLNILVANFFGKCNRKLQIMKAKMNCIDFLWRFLDHPNSLPALSYLPTELSYLSVKSSFTISSHCHQARSFRGAQYSVCPLPFIIQLSCSLFIFLHRSQLNPQLTPQLNPQLSPQLYPQLNTEQTKTKDCKWNGLFFTRRQNYSNCAYFNHYTNHVMHLIVSYW